MAKKIKEIQLKEPIDLGAFMAIHAGSRFTFNKDKVRLSDQVLKYTTTRRTINIFLKE